MKRKRQGMMIVGCLVLLVMGAVAQKKNAKEEFYL